METIICLLWKLLYWYFDLNETMEIIFTSQSMIVLTESLTFSWRNNILRI